MGTEWNGMERGGVRWNAVGRNKRNRMEWNGKRTDLKTTDGNGKEKEKEKEKPHSMLDRKQNGTKFKQNETERLRAGRVSVSGRETERNKKTRPKM